MYMKIIFLILIIFALIRTTAYAVYCMKKTGVGGGVSVIILECAAVFSGYMLLFGENSTSV